MWRTVTLDEVCTLRNGRAYKKPELLSEGKYPVLRVGNFFTSDNWYYSDLELEETKYCANGDLLYAWSASFGPRIWEGGKVIYHYHIWRVDVDETLVDRKFLFYWFEYDKELVKAASGTGTTMMHVSKGSMEKRVLQLPPLAEQQRIVAKLDAAFAEIDKAIQVAESKHTEVENLKTELLSSLLNGEDWETVPLGELYKIGSSKRVLKADWKTDGVPFYRGREITLLSADGHVDNDLFITEQQYQSLSKKSGVPVAGDIMVTAIGTIGNTYLVEPNHKFYFKDASVLWLKKEAEVSSEYIRYWLKTDDFFSQLDKGNGATVDTLTIKKLASVVIQLPPLAEQQRIVAKLDAAFAEIDRANASVLKAKAHYQALKSAILAQELQPPKSEAA